VVSEYASGSQATREELTWAEGEVSVRVCGFQAIMEEPTWEKDAAKGRAQPIMEGLTSELVVEAVSFYMSTPGEQIYEDSSCRSGEIAWDGTRGTWPNEECNV